MYGGRYGEIEPDDPDGSATTYWRISQFMFPFHTLFPARPDGLVPGHIWVPLDNGNTMVYAMGWNPVRPMESAGDWRARTRQLVGEYLPQTSEGLGRWRAKANRSNDYMQDRALQRSSSFSGIPTVPLQDQAMTEPMGPVLDRTQEHLGTADAMIIQTRQRLIKAAKAFRDTGEPPPGVDNPDWFRLRSASATLPRQRQLDRGAQGLDGGADERDPRGGTALADVGPRAGSPFPMACAPRRGLSDGDCGCPTRGAMVS